MRQEMLTAIRHIKAQNQKLIRLPLFPLLYLEAIYTHGAAN